MNFNNESIGLVNQSHFLDENIEPGLIQYNLKAVDIHGNESNLTEIYSIYVPYLFNHSLGTGNNLIGFPGHRENSSSQELLENLMVDGPNVVFMLGQGVGLFNTSNGWSGNLNNITPHSGYWLNTAGIHNWELDFDLGDVDNCEFYNVDFGNNLLSFKWGDGNKSTLEALGGEAFATENFIFILGQGVGLFNNSNGWLGNLNQLEEGKGYWINTSTNDLDFKWGFENCANPANNTLSENEIVNKLPVEYQVNQSTQQAFYLISEIKIDGEQAEEGDFLIAYNNEIRIGSAVYSKNMTILPVMGRDVSEQTMGFLEEGESPTLKLIKSTGEIIDIESDLDGFRNLLVSEIEMLTGNTITLPTEWALSPAFPNPFNPVTTINFNIPKIVESQGMMSLQVYNINGKLIETLIDGRLESGFHTIDWNAKNSPSGVYFVTLVSETFTQTQKIMLLK